MGKFPHVNIQLAIMSGRSLHDKVLSKNLEELFRVKKINEIMTSDEKQRRTTKIVKAC